MKINGGDYKGADKVMPEPHCNEFPETDPGIEGGGSYSGHGGRQVPTPDFPSSKPPMGGTNWGNGPDTTI